MTDNEIIKALECCIKVETYGDCVEMGCPASTKQGCYYYLRTDDDYENTIYIEILKDALDLINRQKAEIERLQKHIQEGVDLAKEIPQMIILTQNEAIKDFAERLKEKHRRITDYDEAGFGCQIFIVEEAYIDKIATEMIGEQE